MFGGFSHMIPTTEADRQLVHRLAKAVGRPARAVELALDWAIENAPLPDPAFRPSLQLHVVLSKNYRGDHTAAALGQWLHLGINAYWARYANGTPKGPGVEYWQVDVPETVRSTLYRSSFREGRGIDAVYAEEYRNAITSLLSEMSGGGGGEAERSVTVEVPTSPEVRSLFKQLEAAAGRLGWDADILVEKRLTELIRRRALPVRGTP